MNIYCTVITLQKNSRILQYKWCDNMIIDKKYKYEIVDEVVFNNQYLQCRSDGSK